MTMTALRFPQGSSPVRLLLVILTLTSCGATAPSQVGEIDTTIADVLANREEFLGKAISVQARIHVEEYWSFEPCAGDAAACDRPFKATVHAVAPGAARSDSTAIDLYRRGSNGQLEALECKVVTKHDFDCSPYTKDQVARVEGTFVRTVVPVQTVTSGGTTTIIQSGYAYVLVVG